MGGSGPVCFSCQCPSIVRIGKLQDLGIKDVSPDKAVRAYLKLYGKKLSGGMIIKKSPDDEATSEGIGFAGILCTYSNAKDIQESFWDIFMGRKAYHEKSNGVMAWQIGLDGTKKSQDSASDGDQDWILALITAYEKINSGEWTLPPSKTGLTSLESIKKEIQRLITSFYDAHIKQKGSRYIYLSTDGAWAIRGDSRDIYYSSYPDPYALCMFSKFDTTHQWLKVSSDVMDLNEEILANYEHLGAKGQNPMPAKVFVSVKADGSYKVENYYTISSAEGVADKDLVDNEEDSIRFFLRMARAAVLTGNEKAKEILIKILQITNIQKTTDPLLWERKYNNALVKAGYGVAAYGAGKTGLAKLLLKDVQGSFDGEGYKDWADAKKYYYYQSVILQSVMLSVTKKIVTPSITECPTPQAVQPGKETKPAVLKTGGKTRKIYPLYLITKTFGGADNLAIYVDNGAVYVNTKKNPTLVLLIQYKGQGNDIRAKQTAESLKTIILKNQYAFLRLFYAGEKSMKRTSSSEYNTLENIASKEVVAYQTEAEYKANPSAMPEMIQKLFTIGAFTPYSWKNQITQLLQKKAGLPIFPQWFGGDEEANVRLLMQLAKYYAYDQNFDKAIEAYYEIITKFGGWKKYPYLYFEALEELAMVHLYKSYSYLKEGKKENMPKAAEQIDKSIKVYEKIIAESNNYKRLASVYYNMAYVYYTKAVIMSTDSKQYNDILDKAIDAINKAESYNTVSGVTGLGRFRDQYLALKIKLFTGDVYMAKFNVYDSLKFETEEKYRATYMQYLANAESMYIEALSRESEIKANIEATITDKFEKKQRLQDFKAYSAEIRYKLAYINMQKWRFTASYPALFNKTIYTPNYALSIMYFSQATAMASELKDNIYFFSGSWEAMKIYYDIKIEESLFEMEKYYKAARDGQVDKDARERALKMIDQVLSYLKYIPLASQKARALLVKGEILMAIDKEKKSSTNKHKVDRLRKLAIQLLGGNIPEYFMNFFKQYDSRYFNVYVN